MGLNRDGLSLIERGLRETTIANLLSLARALEVTPEPLLGGIAWRPDALPGRAPRQGGAQRHAAHGLDATVRRMWCEGKSTGEIANAVGVSPGSVSAIVHRLREHGEAMPHRRPPTGAMQIRARLRRARRRQVPTREDAQVAEAPPEAASGQDMAARIGANVVLLREQAGPTSQQLAEAVESGRTYLHRIEHGHHVPQIALVVKLAASLNVRCERITAGLAWEPDAGAFRLEATDGDATKAPRRLGENALRARRRAGFSQQALAARASICRGDVIDFECAKRTFRMFTAIRLAGALGVGFAELFAGTADWNVRPLPAPEFAPGDRPPSKAERDARLARLWREGRPEREIAEALDLSVGAIGPYIRDLRDGGEELPYRRAARGSAEIAARRRRRP